MIKASIKKSTIRRENGMFIAEIHIPEARVRTCLGPDIDKDRKELATYDTHDNYTSYMLENDNGDEDDAERFTETTADALSALGADDFEAAPGMPADEDILLVNVDDDGDFASVEVATRFTFALEKKERKNNE